MPRRYLTVMNLLWSLGICTVLYVLTAAALTGVVDYTTLTTDDPLAAAMKRMGFENFYGFGGGDTSPWRPNLGRGTTPLHP